MAVTVSVVESRVRERAQICQVDHPDMTYCRTNKESFSWLSCVVVSSLHSRWPCVMKRRWFNINRVNSNEARLISCLQSLLADCQCEDGNILLTSGVASVFRSPMRSSDTSVTVILVTLIRSHSTSVSSTGTSNRTLVGAQRLLTLETARGLACQLIEDAVNSHGHRRPCLAQSSKELELELTA